MRQILIVKGKPKAKGRPRAAVVTGKDGNQRIVNYTPKKTRTWEDIIRWTWISEKRKKLKGKIRLDVYFYFSIPKSYSRSKRVELGTSYYDKKPDIDNLIKTVMDALNDLAFDDDKQVVILVASKFYIDGDPYTEIILMEEK